MLSICNYQRKNQYLRVISSLSKRFVSQTTKDNSTLLIGTNDVFNRKYPVPSNNAYLKSLTKNELFSLSVIGFATLNKPILDLVVKIFPLMPISLIKLLVYSLYCGGDTFQQVRECGKRLQQRGISNMMLSLTIEDSEGTKNIDIDYIVNETISSIHQILKPNLQEQLDKVDNINDIAPGYVALKPSALISDPVSVLLNFENPEWKSQRDTLINNCCKITKEIYDLNNEFLLKYPNRKAPFFASVIDAEKYDLQNAGVYELQRILFSKFNPKKSPLVSCIGTWQLYLRDSAAQLQSEFERAEKEQYKLGLKLVRGAYIHSEQNRDKIIHPSKDATDKNYNQVVTKVIQDLLCKGVDSVYGHLVVASHNYDSQMLATNLLKNIDQNNYGKSNVVLGQLLSMSDNVTYDLVNNHNTKNIIKYVPWGPPLETKDYLLRRLQENGDAVRSDNGWPLLKSVLKTILNV